MGFLLADSAAQPVDRFCAVKAKMHSYEERNEAFTNLIALSRPEKELSVDLPSQSMAAV
jgi:hypothetical protein